MAMPVLGERHLALAEHVPHEAPGRYACIAPESLGRPAAAASAIPRIAAVAVAAA